ncbi:MAG TPA: D-aminoacylase [Bryobacteraceae bacterium]|jgi:N-acyl-D-amino-acid deacylase|nr:D-aminoacylase [Bryobacteraceae bacterium]
MKTKLVALLVVAVAGLTGQDFDVLILNGRIVDGTGNPSFIGDVGTKGGRITAIGRLASRTATRKLDAKGLVVSPGFIDMHNHSDDIILSDGNAESMIRMGVTSMILGEGSSAAPTTEFPRFRDYWATVLKKGVSTNIGSYIGSGLVYQNARGAKPGPATAAEVEKMRQIVQQAMEDGALGVSTSLHQPPGFWLSTEELIEMAKVAARSGGIYATHTRSEGEEVFDSISEAIRIARESGTTVDLLHLKIAHHKLWGQMPELLGVIENARKQGIDVEGHVYPYTAGQNAGLRNIIPPWAHEGGTEKMLERLKDSSLRARLEKDITQGIPGWYNHYTAVGSDWSKIQIVSVANPVYHKYVGKRMSELIADKGKPWLDVLFETLIENKGAVPALYYHHVESDMRAAMKASFVSFGSDGSALKADPASGRGLPHPRSFGTFARVMGRYVRDEKVLSLEEAVRKATSHNAAKIRIYDRGLLRPGMWADVTVFNPDTIADRATYENPYQYATGVEHVLVNGALVIDKGTHTGARPGAILYGPGARH